MSKQNKKLREKLTKCEVELKTSRECIKLLMEHRKFLTPGITTLIDAYRQVELVEYRLRLASEDIVSRLNPEIKDDEERLESESLDYLSKNFESVRELLCEISDMIIERLQDNISIHGTIQPISYHGTIQPG